MHSSTPLWSLWAACTSAVVHALAYASLGAVTDAPPSSPSMMTVEISAPPATTVPSAPPPPPPPPPFAPPLDPTPKPLPAVAKQAAAPPTEVPLPVPEPLEAAGSPLTSDTASSDFSVRRSEGAGVGIARNATALSVPTASPPVLPSMPPLVPVSNLSARPSAPRLDASLRNNYPSDAKIRGISGSASVRARIEPDGVVRVVTLLGESFAGFGEACRRTVRGSIWSPPRDRAGRRVATQIRYTCRFVVSP